MIDVRIAGKPPTSSLVLTAGDKAFVLVVPATFHALAGTKLVSRSAGKNRFVLPLDR